MEAVKPFRFQGHKGQQMPATCFESLLWAWPPTWGIFIMADFLRVFLADFPGSPIPTMTFPGGAGGKEAGCQCRRQKRCRLDPWVRKIPWRRAWQSTPVFLSGESHEQSSLEGYSPWGPKESDMTEKKREPSDTGTSPMAQQ